MLASTPTGVKMGSIYDDVDQKLRAIQSTCDEQPPKGSTKSGCLRQVAAKWR